ncbi:MAG: ABC transporter substrate-binding protein [Acetobacteraceae bacterium]|nr:ABC transporter substrate-binding protein [Acetobacteraceae bacterium]
MAASLAAGVILPLGTPARAQGKPAELKVGMATFLSGGASVFGVPGRNAAELFIERINRAGGIGGVPVRLIVIDEAPGVDHLVGEIRRLVQSERVDALLTAISSGSCLACAPLNEELGVPTLLWDCGTQRIFEERSYKFVARSQANATPEVLSALLYTLKQKPDFRTIAVINQDYAWGRDSWEIWRTAMEVLKPGVRVVAELFPRLGATDFSTEITRLQALRPDIVFSTSWGGDLDTLIRQAAERRLFERSTFVLALAESSLERVGRTLPAGVIIGARGDHWYLHPTAKDTPAMKEFVAEYKAKTGQVPIYPTFHAQQAVSALKTAYDKAIAANGGNWPSPAQVAAAFKGLEFQTLTSGTMKIREDGQGLEPQLIGTTLHHDSIPHAVMTDMIIVPPELVTTPAGQKSVDWLKTLKPDMLAQVPAPLPFRA